jgi:hypothetical protein
MPRRVGDDRVPDLAGAALRDPAACGGGAGLGEPGEQLVARALELGDGRDPGLGAARGPGGGGLRLAGVARELRLDPPDLAAQLAARGPFVAGPPRLLELELGRELGEVRLVGDTFGRALGELGKRRGDGDDHRHLARVEPRGPSRVDRLARDPLGLGGTLGPVGDEAPAAVARCDQAIVLELGVDAAHRVHVHARPLGERAHARHSLAGAEPSRGDQRPQAPRELHRERKLVRGIGAERGRRRAWLCHRGTQ